MTRGACERFRDELTRVLSGRDADGLGRLGWHEHLLGCGACRDLLEEEEALELLLDGLPRPALPRELARRVLEKLAASRGATLDPLDELLDEAWAPGAAPADLADQVLGGLEARRERIAENRRLSALLDQLPTPRSPEGLAERVLVGIEGERRAPARPGLRLLRGGRPAAAAAAAVVVVALGLGRLAPRGSRPTPVAEPERDLLAHIELLADDWELLMGDDLDALLGTLDVEDQLRLELADEED